MVSVLLVDDSEYSRDLLAELLLGAGHNVVGEATSGDEAVEKYQKLMPEVVLMDIVIEIGNTSKTGIDTLKEILAFDPQANIIICSALDEQSLIQESMRIGAKAFVTKPIDPEKLLETVITCSDLGIVAEIGNIGAGRAATILSKLAHQPIHIDLTKLETGPHHLISRFNGPPDRPVTAVHMKLQGKTDCDVLLAFELNEAAKLSNILTEKSPSKNNPALQQSAIKEMCSNTICAFFSAVADFSEMALVPSTPTMVVDSFEAIVDILLAKMEAVSKTALIFQIKLKREAGAAQGIFIILPSPEFQKQLIKKGKNWLKNDLLQAQLIQ